MRLFFNLVGTLLLLAAAYFAYDAYLAWGIFRSALTEPNGALSSAWFGNEYAGDVMVALLALIGAGVFLGSAEIIATLERRHRSVTVEPSDDGA